MKFFNPEVVFDGIIQIDGTINNDKHAITRGFLKANSIVGIHSDSANFAEMITVGDEKHLKIKPLQITDVKVDNVQTSMAAWITANYSVGTEKQEGDIVILTNTSANRPVSFIHNGGSAATIADFIEIEGGDVEASEIRGFLSGSNGINYATATGVITADQAEIRGFFSAGTGLTYNAGSYSFTGSTDNVSEGTNQYFTDARAQAAISVSGTGLSKSGGVISWSASTSLVTEGTNLYFTDARARGAVSADGAAGNLLSYVAGTGKLTVSTTGVRGVLSAGAGLAYTGGQFSFNGSTSLVTEGSNLYYTDGRAQAAISVSGTGLSKSGGVISWSANTGLVTEGSNLYFTNARAQAAISADAAADNMISYSNGAIKLRLESMRKEFSPTSLTAGTWSTLTHNLGKKLVHVSSMDSSGNLAQLEVQYIDSNSLKVKSFTNVSVDIAVSL